MNISPCSICLDPLIDPNIVWSPRRLQNCNHQFHVHCLINFSDHIHITQPQETSLKCPECRTVSPIPTAYSPAEILRWTENAIQLGIRAPRDKIIVAVMHVYNVVFNTNITSVNIRSLQVERSANPLANTMKHFVSPILNQYINNYEKARMINKVNNAIDNIPFDEEERRVMRAWSQLFGSSEEHLQNLCQRVLKYCIAFRPDLLAAIRNYNGRLLVDADGVNEELKDNISEFVSSIILNLFYSSVPMTEAMAVPMTEAMARRIHAVASLFEEKNSLEWSSEVAAEKFSNLNADLIQECRQPNSDLLDALTCEQNSFSQLPLLTLLFDAELQERTLKTIYFERRQFFKDGRMVIGHTSIT